MGKKAVAALTAIDTILKGGKKNRKKGKKGRKIGRSKRHPAAQRYLGEKRWIRNRVRRIERHLKRYPDDKQAQRALSAARDAA